MAGLGTKPSTWNIKSSAAVELYNNIIVASNEKYITGKVPPVVSKLAGVNSDVILFASIPVAVKKASPKLIERFPLASD